MSLFSLLSLLAFVQCFHGIAALPSAQCSSLVSALGAGRVLYPVNPLYAVSLESYYAQQEEQINPTCIVIPTSIKDVSTAVKILSGFYVSDGSQFAVRSGGHSCNAGAANIDDGVTISLAGLSGVTLSSDHSVTSIGPGARWGQVYPLLDAMGLALPGGRDARVGVGGLSTGGGISYYSPRKGFVCDNVVNYQIVLANGTVANANATSNPDLWVALRGGSNNFGVVTSVDIATFPNPLLWGGFIYMPISTIRQTLQAFSNLDVGGAGYDEYASIICSWSYVAGTYASITNPVYTKPEVNPPVYRPFTSIQPQILSTMRISNLTSLTVEQASLSQLGQRELFVTTTFKNDLSFLNLVYDLWNATIPQIAAVPGCNFPVSIQPIPPAITSKSAPNGGDSLGIDPADGPLVLLLVATSWELAADDATVTAAAKGLVDRIAAAAKARGLDNPYLYMNYAASGQDVIGGYGAANKAKLQAVASRYDPQAVFQGGVPGGFKLFT